VQLITTSFYTFTSERSADTTQQPPANYSIYIWHKYI